MAKFMLLLYDTPTDFQGVSPEQMQQIVQEYYQWAGKLGQEGVLAGGEKLKEEGGKVLRRGKSKAEVTDGPYSETKEVVGGIFLINADNYAAAVEIAKTCPHMKYGPKIEVREIDPGQQ